jgi:hypothetical protein
VHAIAELQLLSWQQTYGPLVLPAERVRFTIEEHVAAWHRVLRWPNPCGALQRERRQLRTIDRSAVAAAVVRERDLPPG